MTYEQTWFLVKINQEGNQFHDWLANIYPECSFIKLDKHLVQHRVEEIIVDDENRFYTLSELCLIHDTTNRQ